MKHERKLYIGVILTLICLCVALLIAAITASAGQLNRFDVNGDGVTNIGDVTAVLTYLSGGCEHQPTLTGELSPTCVSTGYTAHRVCALCGEALEEYTVLEKTAHTIVIDAAVAPTCTEAGLSEGSHCSVCSEVFTAQESVPATGHTYGDWAVTTPAACTEAGVETKTCTACGDAVTQSVPATGHTPVDDPAVAPTCTETGLTAGSHCSVCGEVFTAQESIPATGHTIVNVSVVAPTCTEDGWAFIYCSDCGDYLGSETFPATGHTPVADAAVAPTCTETGLTAGSHCSVCGAVLTAQTAVAALGHNYVNGTCTRCGDVQQQTVQKGDIYTFGSYEQDNDLTNGSETIEWIVLDVVDGKALLLSKYALDAKPYNTTDTSVTWETCTLRSWLNGTFYNTAFNSSEKAQIASTTLVNANNPNYGTNGGNNTVDNVFLLSLSDINNTNYGFASDYYEYDTARRCQPTEYAKAQGCWWEDDTRRSYYGNCWWWLRSPGYDSDFAEDVSDEGGVGGGGSRGNGVDSDDIGVRPALWIDLSGFEEPATQTINIGDIYTFGSYEQDNDTSNGKEAIEWIVLDVVDGKALLLSKYALDCKPYNTTYTSVTWETCTLRSWLNGTFYNTAFSSSEKAKIQSTTLVNANNPNYGTNGGNDTTDKVFLLSIGDANAYFSSNEARMCAPTDYARAQGAYTSSSYSTGGRATCWWWLRSPGNYSNYAAYVYCDGSVFNNGYGVSYSTGAVLPALWINL